MKVVSTGNNVKLVQHDLGHYHFSLLAGPVLLLTFRVRSKRREPGGVYIKSSPSDAFTCASTPASTHAGWSDISLPVLVQSLCAIGLDPEPVLNLARQLGWEQEDLEQARSCHDATSLWCKHCDWRGIDAQAGWDEDEGEWTCPVCGGAEWIRTEVDLRQEAWT